MAAKSGVQAIFDEVINPAERARMNPQVLRRIDAAVQAGGEVAAIFDANSGRAIAALDNPAEAKKVQAAMNKEIGRRLKKLENFQTVKKEITRGQG